MNLDPACNSFIVASHICVPCLSTNKWGHAIDGTDPPLEGLYLLLIRVLVYHRYIILRQVFSPYIQVPHICIIYLSLRNTAARRVATRLWPRRSQLWKWRRWRCASTDVGWWKTLKSGMYIPYLRFPSGCINILIWYEVRLVNKPEDACKCINVYKYFWMKLAWWPYLCMFNFNHNSFKTGDGHSWGWFQ